MKRKFRLHDLFHVLDSWDSNDRITYYKGLRSVAIKQEMSQVECMFFLLIVLYEEFLFTRIHIFMTTDTYINIDTSFWVTSILPVLFLGTGVRNRGQMLPQPKQEVPNLDPHSNRYEQATFHQLGFLGKIVAIERSVVMITHNSAQHPNLDQVARSDYDNDQPFILNLLTRFLR